MKMINIDDIKFEQQIFFKDEQLCDQTVVTKEQIEELAAREPCTNADKIRGMDDEQLANLLWTWKINSIAGFMSQGGAFGMRANDLHAWIGDDKGFVCEETKVPEEFSFGQDFKEIKEAIDAEDDKWN